MNSIDALRPFADQYSSFNASDEDVTITIKNGTLLEAFELVQDYDIHDETKKTAQERFVDAKRFRNKLSTLVTDNKEKLEKAHTWIWSHTAHPEFRNQCDKYNELEYRQGVFIRWLAFIEFFYKTDGVETMVIKLFETEFIVSCDENISVQTYLPEEIASQWLQNENYWDSGLD